MRENLKVARFYLVLLALFTVGRWAQSLGQVEYAKAHHVFSIVTLTFLSSAFFAAFCRKWRGYTLLQAVMLGMMLGLIAQVVIFASTALSYALGLHTFFNHPAALNVESRAAHERGADAPRRRPAGGADLERHRRHAGLADGRRAPRTGPAGIPPADRAEC